MHRCFLGHFRRKQFRTFEHVPNDSFRISNLSTYGPKLASIGSIVLGFSLRLQSQRGRITGPDQAGKFLQLLPSVAESVFDIALQTVEFVETIETAFTI